MTMMTDKIFATGGGWNGDGLHGEQVTTAADILEKSGLDFEVEGRPVLVPGPNGEAQRVPGYKAITRKDTGHVFSIRSEAYGILQPKFALNVLDEAAGQGACIYTSAGAIDGGAKMFVTARIPQEIRIGKEDLIKPYLSVINSFDGSTAAIVKALSFRQICRNTFMRSLRSEHETEFRVLHTSNVQAKLRVAMNAMAAAGYTFQKLGETYQAMGRTRFSERDMVDMTKVLVPADDESEISTRTRNARETLVTLYEIGKGQREFADIRGTAWAAFNAVTEYVDHLRPTRGKTVAQEEESRLESAWFGSGAHLKERAFDYLTQRAQLTI